VTALARRWLDFHAAGRISNPADADDLFLAVAEYLVLPAGHWVARQVDGTLVIWPTGERIETSDLDPFVRFNERFETLTHATWDVHA
jgi:hypothetical protein